MSSIGVRSAQVRARVLSAASVRVAPYAAAIERRVGPFGEPLIARLRQQPWRVALVAASAFLLFLVLLMVPTRQPSAGYLDVLGLWLLSIACWVGAFAPSTWIASPRRSALRQRSPAAGRRANNREVWSFVAVLTLAAAALGSGS